MYLEHQVDGHDMVKKKKTCNEVILTTRNNVSL